MNSTNYLIMEKTNGNGNKRYYIVRKNSFARTEETFCFITKFRSDSYKYYDCDEYYGFADLSKKQNHKPSSGILSWFMPSSCGSTEEKVCYYSDLEEAKDVVRSFAPETTNVAAVM